MSTYTQNLAVTELEPSQAQPHIVINEAFRIFDQAIAGKLAKTLTGSTSLTSQESVNSIIDFTGTPGTEVTVTVPDTAKTWVVRNSTNSSITFKPASGSGVTINPGELRMLVCDGVDISGVTASGGGGSGTGSLDNDTTLGDGTAGDKTITADTGVVNKPYLRFDYAVGRWVIADDGINDVPLNPIKNIHLGMMAVYTSAQTPVFVCGEDTTLTDVEVLADKAPGAVMGVSLLQIPSGMTCNHSGFKVASGTTGWIAYKSATPCAWTKARFFLANKTDAEKNAPKDYKWQGSNDSTNGADGTWADLKAVTAKAVLRHEWSEDTWTNATAYTWLKLNVSAAQAGATTLEVCEVEGFVNAALHTPKNLTANGTEIYSSAAAVGFEGYKAFDGTPTEVFAHNDFTSDVYAEIVDNIALPANTRFYGKINGLVNEITSLEFVIKAKGQWT
jgi:hypothetical protein